MRTFIKIILCIAVFLIVVVFGGLLQEANGGRGFGPIYWIIVLPAAFATWKAIWKYNPEGITNQPNHAYKFGRWLSRKWRNANPKKENKYIKKD